MNKQKLFNDIEKHYKILFDEIRSEDATKKSMKEKSLIVENSLEHFNNILKKELVEKSSLEERKQLVKDYLNIEDMMHDVVMKATNKNSPSYPLLEKRKEELAGAIITYDRDMVDEENYQATYTRHKPNNLTKTGLPKDNVVSYFNKEEKRIGKENVSLVAYDNPLYKINQVRLECITNSRRLYSRVQKELLKDILPLEKKLNKENKRNIKGLER